MPDLTRFAKKFQTGNGNLQDVARVYQLVIRLPAILDTLKVVGEEEHSERHRQIILETYAKPLEVCRISEIVTWLTSVAGICDGACAVCRDGRNYFGLGRAEQVSVLLPK